MNKNQKQLTHFKKVGFATLFGIMVGGIAVLSAETLMVPPAAQEELLRPEVEQAQMPEIVPPPRVPIHDTSERFLEDTGGISRPAAPKEMEEAEVPARVIPEDKDVYEKEQCEEIPHGWSCTAFYGGGRKKATVDKQHYQEGDSEKGSSWKGEHRIEWDKDGNVIKDETLRTQAEWQHNESKDYIYIQIYKNGILIDEKYEEKLTDPQHKEQGLLVQMGRL